MAPKLRDLVKGKRKGKHGVSSNIRAEPTTPSKSLSKGQSSGIAVAPAYDESRFNSIDAARRFEHTVSKKKCIEETVFRLGPEEYPDIQATIAHYGWGSFCTVPVWPYSITLVQEFYANAWADYQTYKEIKKVFIRGVEVEITAESINALFGLPHLEQVQYNTIYDTIDEDDLLSTLCPFSSVWIGKPGQLRSQDMSRTAKTWLHFISRRIMPVSHFHKVPRIRILVRYAIMKRLSMNVGKLIYQEFLYCAHGKCANLYFPSIITEICRRAHVPIANDELQIPSQLLDKTFIEHLREPKRARMRNPGARTSVKTGPSQSGRSTWDSTVDKRLTRLEQDMSSLADMVRALAVHGGMDMTQYPSLFFVGDEENGVNPEDSSFDDEDSKADDDEMDYSDEVDSEADGDKMTRCGDAVRMVSEANAKVHEMKDKMVSMEQTCTQMAAQKATMMSMMASMQKGSPEKCTADVVAVSSDDSEDVPQQSVRTWTSHGTAPSTQTKSRRIR